MLVASPLQRADETAQIGVCHRLHAVLATLRAIVERQHALDARDMVAAHRRQTERLVLLGVLLTADAEEPEVEESCCGREHSRAIDLGTTQISKHALARG